MSSMKVWIYIKKSKSGTVFMRKLSSVGQSVFNADRSRVCLPISVSTVFVARRITNVLETNIVPSNRDLIIIECHESLSALPFLIFPNNVAICFSFPQHTQDLEKTLTLKEKARQRELKEQRGRYKQAKDELQRFRQDFEALRVRLQVS